MHIRIVSLYVTVATLLLRRLHFYYMNLSIIWNKETTQQNIHFFTHKLNGFFQTFSFHDRENEQRKKNLQKASNIQMRVSASWEDR